MKEQVLKYIKIGLKVILDCIEESFDTLTVAKGKQVTYVLLVLVGMLVITIVCKVLGLSCFTSWQEVVTAIGLMLIICVVSIVSRVQLKTVLTFLNRDKKEG